MTQHTDDEAGFGLLPFLTGFGLGVVAAILFAPSSGEETRGFIADTVREGKDVVVEAVEEFSDQVEVAVSGAKKKVEGALEMGKDAYRREIMQKHSGM
jgi:gas vesicle protein